MIDTLQTLDEAEASLRELDHSWLDVPLGALDVLVTTSSSRHALARPRLELEGRPLAFERAALGHVLRRLGISSALLRELGDNAGLLVTVLRHLQARRASQTVRLVFAGGTVVAVEDAGEPGGLTLAQAWEAVRELPDVHGVQPVRRKGGRFQLRVVAGVAEHPPRHVGDVSYGGVCVSVNGEATATPFVFRLVCTNGMQLHRPVPTGEEASAPAGDPAEAFARRLHAAHEASQRELQRWIATDEQVVRHPARHLDHVMRERGLPATHRRALLDQLPPGEALSLYDLVNLVTAHARELPDLDAADRFERLGGDVLHSGDDDRPRCRLCNAELEDA